MLRGLLIALTLGWELYAVVAVSDAGVGFIDVALTIPSACLLALAWALPWGTAGRLRPWLPAIWASFCVLGTALVAIYLTSQSPVNPLFRARFLASERALTRAAKRMESGSTQTERLRVGLFRANYATVMSPDEVRFLTADCGVVDQCGLAYRPHSRPASARYAHIRGPWYLVYEPF
jgi:hypothetical protein